MALDHTSDFPPPRRKTRGKAQSAVAVKKTLEPDLDELDALDDPLLDDEDDDQALDPDEIEFPSEEPFEDHVAESKRHFVGRTKLWNVTEDILQNVSIGSDQFIYYDPKSGKRCLAPDLFIKLESTLQDFDKWKTWELGIPELAVELASKNDRLKLTWRQKLRRYKACGVKELLRFDRKNPKQWLRVWDRVGKRLIERTSGVYECRTLGLYWTVKVHPVYGPQLRLARDRQGDDLLPSPSERFVEEAQARIAAEQKQHEAEAKQHEEAQARIAAEQKHHEEAQARIAAEQKQHEAEAKLEALMAELKRRNGLDVS